jgi:hypothetical protein
VIRGANSGLKLSGNLRFIDCSVDGGGGGVGMIFSCSKKLFFFL